jgi:hypothetical protein
MSGRARSSSKESSVIRIRAARLRRIRRANEAGIEEVRAVLVWQKGAGGLRLGRGLAL